jgi:hypothetical protein
VLRLVWHVCRVAETTKHQEVETQFRKLLADSSLPEPDAVGYEPESVVFYWTEPKLAVFVDFDD